MKKSHLLFFPCFFTVVLFSCKHHAKPPSPLIELVNKKFEAMNKHDVNAIVALYADSALIQSPNMDKTEIGKAGAKGIYERYFLTSPDMVYDIRRILPGDSSITVEYTFSGTMKHLENSVPTYMLNKIYSIKACMVLEIRKGLIVADISYFDQVAFLRQVGFFEKH